MANVNWLASRLVEDETHRLVTDTEKATWNGKANASHNIPQEILQISRLQ